MSGSWLPGSAPFNYNHTPSDASQYNLEIDLNLSLNYNLHSDQTFPNSSFGQSEQSDLHPASSSLSTFPEFQSLEEDASSRYSLPSPSLTPENRRRISIVDLTHSPPLNRHQPIERTYTDAELFGDDFFDDSLDPGFFEDMPRRRSPRQPRRGALTPAASTSRSQSLRQSNRRRSFHSEAGPSRADQQDREIREDRPIKRQRLGSSRPSTLLDQPALAPQQPEAEPPGDVAIEEVDLTEVNDPSSLAKALSKQREDAVKAAQQSTSADDGEGRTVLTSYKCPICMDVLEDATSTVCGHLFCHKCIMDTLKSSEFQRSDDIVWKAKGRCPICRKPLIRSDKADKTRTLIPLALELQVSTRPKGKGKEKEVERESPNMHNGITVNDNTGV